MTEMGKKKWFVMIIFLGLIFCSGATHDPWDGTKWDITAPGINELIGNHYKEIYDLRIGIATRINKEHETLATSDAGGVHKQGSARAFFQDAAPATQVNGDAFDSGDLGSLWFDTNASPDNQFNVLTATTPTWTPISTEIIAVLLASNRQFAGTLTVDGATTLTGMATANGGVTLGAGADLISSSTSDITINTNKFTVDGASGNTLVAGTLDVAGNIDPTTYEATNGGFLDEDDMASDAADKVVSQQSIKAHTAFSAFTANDSTPAAMVKAHAYLAATNGFVVAYSADIDAGEAIRLYIGATNDPAGAGTLIAAGEASGTNQTQSISFSVASGEYFEIVCEGTAVILWRSRGTLSAPVDQD